MDDYINNVKNGDPISGPNRALNFVSCVFQNANNLNSIETCSNLELEPDQYRTYIEYIRLNTVEVENVMQKMRYETLAVISNIGTLVRVPLVTVNGIADYNALDDLVQETCAQYQVSNNFSSCIELINPDKHIQT